MTFIISYIENCDIDAAETIMMIKDKKRTKARSCTDKAKQNNKCNSDIEINIEVNLQNSKYQFIHFYIYLQSFVLFQ